jgi:hypothetical protein
MFDLFGKEKKANEKHEQKLKAQLANRLVNYEPPNNSKLSKFVNVDFDEFREAITAITMIEFSNDPWTAWAKENPSEIGVFNKLYKIKG